MSRKKAIHKSWPGILAMDVGLVLEVNSGFQHALVGRRDVCHLEVQNRARMVELRLLRPRAHQPDTAAIEEGQFAGAEEKRQPKYVALKGRSTAGLTYIDGNLPQTRNPRSQGAAV